MAIMINPDPVMKNYSCGLIRVENVDEMIESVCKAIEIMFNCEIIEKEEIGDGDFILIADSGNNMENIFLRVIEPDFKELRRFAMSVKSDRIRNRINEVLNRFEDLKNGNKGLHKI